MRAQGRTAERDLAQIVHATHGVATRRRLLAAGLSRAEIESRLRTGALLRVHRGVYRVGHRSPSIEAEYLAAVLACGDRAMLSGRAAGHLLGLLRGAPARPEVTSPTQRRVAGVTTHRARGEMRPDRTVHRGIPVTTVARTLVDLATALSPSDLARACHEAEVRHGTRPDQVEAVLARRPNSRGATSLRSVLRGDTRVTLSRLESRFLERLAAARLPLPSTNRVAGGRRVDCRWPERRLTVEVDGFRYHRSRHAWEQDRRREREAHARGDDFRRFTYGDVCEDPALMMAELRDLLGGRSA